MKYDLDTFQYLAGRIHWEAGDDLEALNIEQPNLFFQASEGFAFACSVRDKKEYDLQTTTAVCDKEIREAFEADDEKITEDKVKKQLHREFDYQSAYKEYLNACLWASRWEALKNAYRARNDALRNLVQLHNSNYFGEVTGAPERRVSRVRFDERRNERHSN